MRAPPVSSLVVVAITLATACAQTVFYCSASSECLPQQQCVEGRCVSQAVVAPSSSSTAGGPACAVDAGVCQVSEYCAADPPRCVTRCDEPEAAPCLGDTTCQRSGVCERSCLDSECLVDPGAQLCDRTTNRCQHPDTVTGNCPIVTSGAAPGDHAIPPYQVDGPILWKPNAHNAGTGGPRCAAGESEFSLSFRYTDASGEMLPTLDPTTLEPLLYPRVQTWQRHSQGITWRQGFDHVIQVGPSSTTAVGDLTLSYCHGELANYPSEIVISLTDEDGATSNILCAAF
ncbi:MAG: hypothetical protein AB2A00_10690 [Myxococcota bacterium]